MTGTLFKYIFGKQLKTMIFVSLAVFGLIWLFDFAEVSRKFSVSNLQEILFAIKLSLLRAPITFCQVLNYIYFITVTFSLWDLCRSHQITMLKSFGKSPIQILIPFIFFSVCMSCIWLFALHPLGIASEDRYNLEAKNSTYVFDTNNDIWIDCNDKHQVIFIKSIHQNQVSNFCLFDLNKNRKIFAESGEIQKDQLHLYNVSVFEKDSLTNIANTTITEGISSELISFLSLPAYKQNIYSLGKVYSIQKASNVNLRLYELALHQLLVNCISFIVFALLAAVICFPINRYKTKTDIAIQVIFYAFASRFLNSVLESLAYSGVISVILSSWAVTLVLISLSISVLIWKEL